MIPLTLLPSCQRLPHRSQGHRSSGWHPSCCIYTSWPPGRTAGQKRTGGIWTGHTGHPTPPHSHNQAGGSLASAAFTLQMPQDLALQQGSPWLSVQAQGPTRASSAFTPSWSSLIMPLPSFLIHRPGPSALRKHLKMAYFP